MLKWIKQFFCRHYYPGSPTRVIQDKDNLGILLIPLFEIYVIRCVKCVKCDKIDKQFVTTTMNNILLNHKNLFTSQGSEMPLIKGKKAKSKKGFSENIKREMEAGKQQKQAVAIAYSEAKEKKKKK